MSAGLLLSPLLVFSASLVGIAVPCNRLVCLRNATRNAHARLDAAEREFNPLNATSTDQGYACPPAVSC